MLRAGGWLTRSTQPRCLYGFDSPRLSACVGRAISMVPVYVLLCAFDTAVLYSCDARVAPVYVGCAVDRAAHEGLGVCACILHILRAVTLVVYLVFEKKSRILRVKQVTT